MLVISLYLDCVNSSSTNEESNNLPVRISSFTISNAYISVETPMKSPPPPYGLIILTGFFAYPISIDKLKSIILISNLGLLLIIIFSGRKSP